MAVKRVAVSWLVMTLAAVTVDVAWLGSTSTAQTGDTTDATVAALQTEVAELRSTVATYQTVHPLFAEDETEDPPLAATWRVEVLGVETYDSYPDYDDNGTRVSVKARGKIVAVRLAVTNTDNKPADYFPSQNLLLEDAQGRTFSYDSDATSSYVVFQTDIYDNQPDGDLQPGLTYEEALAFDVPTDVKDLALVSEDGGVRIALPTTIGTSVPPTPTSSPTPTSPPTPTVAPTQTPTATASARVGDGTQLAYGQWRIEIVSVETRDQLESENDFLEFNADGIYYLVTLRIANMGDRSVPFPFDDFVLQERYGATYPTLDFVVFPPEGDGFERGDALIPENTYTRTLAFDVPPEAQGLTLRSMDGSLAIELGR